MRFSLLVGLSIAPLALGCMSATKAAPAPADPNRTTESTSSGEGAAPDREHRPIEEREATRKTAESADGLGLTGSGKGGGGTGQGIGLGDIGTLGHGAGTGQGQGYGAGAGGGAGGAKGRVAAATATTTGSGIPPEVISRIVRANVSRIQACYEKAMAKSPSLAGKVDVKFVIDASGAVASASAADTNITDADMVSCVVGAVKGMAFPQPDGGSLVVVTYPFNFSSDN